LLICPFDKLTWLGDIRLAFSDLSINLGEVLAFKFCHRPFPQSSSASRFTAGASAFFILSQSGERHYVWVQVSPPSEDNPGGAIADAVYTVADGTLYLLSAPGAIKSGSRKKDAPPPVK
jgi:hypothetical protein